MGAIVIIWIGTGDEVAIAAAVMVVRYKALPPHSSADDVVLNRRTLLGREIIIG